MTEYPVTTIRILLVGAGDVGKTSLLLRLADDKFDPAIVGTLGANISEQLLNVDGTSINLLVWDVAGYEWYRMATPCCYEGLQGALLVFDVGQRITFNKVHHLLAELDRCDTKPNMVKMIVGNKTDSEQREVSAAEAEEYARSCGALYVETSAKTGENVNEAFLKLVRKILQTPGLWEANNSHCVL